MFSLPKLAESSTATQRKKKKTISQLTAISVAAENASGNVVETKREGATTIVAAMTFILFLPHQFSCPKNFLL